MSDRCPLGYLLWAVIGQPYCLHQDVICRQSASQNKISRELLLDLTCRILPVLIIDYQSLLCDSNEEESSLIKFLLVI